MKAIEAKEKKALGRNAFRGGSYSLILSLVVLLILVVVNLFASALPKTLTNLDISSSKLYSITSNTKVVVNNLEKDVTIYWIVQSGEEDSVIQNLLDKYDSLSDHIEVVKKNPDVYPTFAEQYTDETVANNSLVVVSGDRYRYIAYSDIYVTESNVYSYSYTSSFDGEGAITSAIDYVVTEDLPQMYVLEGHGESELPSTFADQLEKENVETTSFSLLNVDEVPEEADAVLIYAPSSDLSEEEAAMLSEYVKNGGKLLVFAGPVEDSELTNLYSVLSDYGVTANEGIVVEEDREYYAFSAPYVLMPDIASSDITDSLIDENYYVIMPISLGMTVDSFGSGTVTELLTTSDTSFSKIAGYSIDTYEKEDGDIDGGFALAVDIETDGEGEMIWFSSSVFLEDMYNAYSSGANVDLAMNAVTSLVGEREAIAIHSKSLNYNYLTISDSTSSLIKVLLIGVFPICYLGLGIWIYVARRRKQNEAV